MRSVVSSGPISNWKVERTRVAVTSWTTPLIAAVDEVADTGPWAKPTIDCVENPPLSVGTPVTTAVLTVHGWP